MPASRRATPVAAAVLAVASLLLLSSPGAVAARAAARACSSYPVPGTSAPAGTQVPAAMAARYAILRRPQRPIDRLKASQITASLSASGLIMSGTRFLGDAAFGAKVYLVPAEHELSYRLAPLRCIPVAQRSLERELAAQLRRQYRHTALCIVLIDANSGSPTCSPTGGAPDAMLYASGTPGFGLVPDGVSAVTVTYETSPSRTMKVRGNFFAIDAPRQPVPPCGLQWLDPTGTVLKIVVGCSYLRQETDALVAYRAYVATELATLKTQVAALSSAIASGSVLAAESAWLTAHLTWLDIGQDDGAYGCFGTLGGEIDGLAAGHPLGTSDPGFTGFHRIEYDLWTTGSLSAAATDTAVLQSRVAQLMEAPLSSYLPATATGIGNWVLRPHEVLEDALRDSLTADDDYGSGTDLASITADVAAVRELLSLLEPTLDPLAPHLARHAEGELGALISVIDAAKVNDAWVPVEDLGTRQRQQIDADVGAVLETLAPVPDLLTSTGHNAPLD